MIGDVEHAEHLRLEPRWWKLRELRERLTEGCKPRRAGTGRERLRETAVDFGHQRIYASHKSVMFSRKSCYFFVRPKKTFLEVCVFLGRTVKAPQVRRADRTSKSKVAHMIQIRHRDEVEAPLTDWLREAYELSDGLSPNGDTVRAKSTARSTTKQKKKNVARTSAAARKSKGR